MADPADRAAFQTLATVKEEPSDLDSEAGDIKVGGFFSPSAHYLPVVIN
jgi:hypothetical protein